MLMQKHKTARRVFQCLGGGIAVYPIVLLVIPLLGPGGHLLHGDFISYGGWRVPVPKGFYVGKSKMGPAMWKHTLGIPLFNAPYGHISLYSRRINDHLHMIGIILDSKKVLLKKPSDPSTNSDRNERSRSASIPRTV
jgi:hypothetical protein